MIMKLKVCFDLEAEDLRTLDQIAEKQERSRSFILRDAVRKYLSEI